MATPIRQLLNPKLSPIISGAYRATNINPTSPLQGKLLRTRNCSKALNFHLSPNNLPLKHNSPIKEHARTFDNKNSLTVNYNQRSLLINTPNKNGLQRNGLDSFRNLKILGRGFFGTVVHGIYKDVDVAVKIVKLPKNKSSLLKETNALHLNHENVVKIIDVVCSSTSLYGIILMEYLNCSRQLQSILEDKYVNLNQQAIVKYALDVCKGLLYCHDSEVLHLDLKPSNILVCENGACKLCDFGNSLRLGSNDHSCCYQATVAYAAPELLMGKQPTCKSDVYSLGIVLWQMRYREMPYRGFDNPEMIIYKVVKFNCRPNSSAVLLEDEYFFLYSSCWSPTPANRPDIQSIVNILKKLI